MFIRINTHKAFNKIGHSNGSVLPIFDRTGMSNQQVDEIMETLPLVHELFVASELRSAANARYDAIKKLLIEKSIIDPEQVKEGSRETVYLSPVYLVHIDAKRAAVRVDTKKLATELARRNIPQSVIDEAFEAASTKSAPARTISVTTVND